MNKYFLIVIFIILISSISAETYIFSGEIEQSMNPEESKLYIEPIIPVHLSRTQYPEETSEIVMNLKFKNLDNEIISQYNVDNKRIENIENITYFYFLADIPHATSYIEFNYDDVLIENLNLNTPAPIINDFNLSNSKILEYNITYTGNNNLFLSLEYLNENSEYYPVIFEQQIPNLTSSINLSNHLIPGGQRQFKLTIYDYFNSAEQTKTIKMPDNPPMLVIKYPFNNTIENTNKISASVYAEDIDTTINPDEILWELDGIETDKSGKYIEIDNLAQGEHELKAKINNTNVSDKVYFEINPNATPYIEILNSSIKYLEHNNQEERYYAEIDILGHIDDYACFTIINLTNEDEQITKGPYFGIANFPQIISFDFFTPYTNSHQADISLECFETETQNQTTIQTPPAISKEFAVPYCHFADINKDGEVNLNDLGILAGKWGKNNCIQENLFCRGADINKDGEVNLNDLGILAGKWGGVCLTS